MRIDPASAGLGRREFILQSAGLGLLAVMPAGLRAEPSVDAEDRTVPASPFDVGNRAQLFIDDFIVAATSNVSKTQHLGEKHSANPLIRPDQPWEHGMVQIYGDVLFDDESGLFRMWYITNTKDLFSERSNTCHATSADGIRWAKPLTGTVPSRTGMRTNVVMKSVELASVMKDPGDADSRRRYKAVCWIDSGPERGALTMISPDGLNWTRYSPGRIFECSDVVTAFYDKRHGRYVAMAKDFAEIRGHRRRVFNVSTSTDFLNWTRPEPALRPDLRDDAGSLGRIERIRGLLQGVPDDPTAMRTEFYGAGFYPAESCIVAFPWIFTINRNSTPRSTSNAGCIEVQLAVSRDLKNWERPFRNSCLPLDGPGAWDEGMVVTQSRAFRVGDEIRLYYSGFDNAHGMPKAGGGIGLARWKLDRFVSVDGSSDGGSLTTIPIVFSGDRMELNAAVAEGGSLTVEPLDLLGQALPGFGPSEPLRGDSLRHRVTWNLAGIDRLKSTPLRLRFRMRKAQLFAFAFRN